MLKVVLAAVAAALVFASVLPANAAGPSAWRYGEVGGWDIMVDPTIGNGCFAFSAYERGSLVRIGIDKADGKIYLVFGNSNWRAMEVGKGYRLEFVFDGYSRYTGDVTVKEMSGYTFLSHNNISVEFARDFANRNGLEILWGNRSLLKISLSNTAAAISAIVRCQEQVDGTHGPGSDRSTGGPGEFL